MKIEIVLSEFGQSRGNAGDSDLPSDRLEPSLSSFLKHFPEATATIYTDQPWKSRDRVTVAQVGPTFDRHSRWGWRENDYWCARGILESRADIVLSIDSDLLIVSPDVRAIIPIVQRWKMAMPTNGRHICWRDAASDCDGGRIDDETLGCGTCHCTALWAWETSPGPHRKLLESYCEQIQSDAIHNRGARGPLSLWRAEWATGITPYTLPREWCITGSNLGDVKKNGRTIPIVLHVGHETVTQHYRELIG
jgi:hypothetical protein